jgi:YbbR domain-containing protein
MRIVRFIFRNWPLKIGAILLAVMLYGAMVVLQTTQQFPGTVAVETVNQPPNSYLVKPDPMPAVRDIKYLAPSDVPISQSSFRATIDLTGAKVSDSDYSWVKVQLVSTDQRIQVVDYQPQQIRVTLDQIIQRTVDVHVDYGTPPAGLQPGTPVLSASTVSVSGAASIVSRVSYAQARVRIDSSGLDVSQDPDLVAIDASGNPVDNVTFSPRTVHVDIRVRSQISSKTVPVDVADAIHGNPAPGYYITSIDITPPTVEVQGQADALALLKGKANTAPISVAGATSDISVKVNLALPDHVTSDTATQISVVIHLQSPMSTRSLTVGVVMDGARSDRAYTLSTPSVVVTLGGATAALSALDPATLVASVSVVSLDTGSHAVNVTFSAPAGIRVVAISPSQITVTIATAAAPSPSPIPS